MKKTIIFLAICLTMIDCSSEKKTTPIINLLNANQSKVINLSDMLRDIYIVRLETSEEILSCFTHFFGTPL